MLDPGDIYNDAQVFLQLQKALSSPGDYRRDNDVQECEM